MVNPVTVMKMLNERKKFMANHPHFFDFFVLCPEHICA